MDLFLPLHSTNPALGNSRPNVDQHSQAPAWERITDLSCHNNENLTADIRVSQDAVAAVSSPSIWQRLKITMRLEKAPIYASGEETLIHLRESVEHYFLNHLQKLTQEIGIESTSDKDQLFDQQAQNLLEEITSGLTKNFPSHQEVSEFSSSEAIQEAHQLTLNSLASLRREFATPQKTPQFCKTKDGKWTILHPAPYSENVVFPGAGVKGTGYVGWMNAAGKFGKLEKVRRVAGTSAGAIPASLLAFGVTPKEFEVISDGITFPEILKRDSNNLVINSQIALEEEKEKGWLSLVERPGSYVIEYLNKEIQGLLKKYFSTFEMEHDFMAKIENFHQDKKITQEEKKTLTALYQQIISSPSSTYMATFQDLAALVKIDSRFKELTITGYAVEKKEGRYFNAARTPLLPVAMAIRATMGLPVFFTKVMIDGELITDGGITSNIPTEVFKDFPQETTLVLGLENGGGFHQVVHGTPEDKPGSLMGRWGKRFTTTLQQAITSNPHITEQLQHDSKKLFDAGPNALVVSHGELGMLSFNARQADLNAARRQAEICAAEAFLLRQNQAIASEPGTFQDAVSYLLKHYSLNEVFTLLQDEMKGMSESELEDIALYYSSTPRQGDPLTKEERFKISKAAQDELETR